MDVLAGWLLAFAAAAGDGDFLPPRTEAARQIRSPAEDLESKIREGLAKRVNPARILDAIRHRRDSFRTLAASLEKELREAGRDMEGGARCETVLEMHRAMDLGLARESVQEVLREALRARGTDAELPSAVVHFAGVAGGSGMPSDQVERIVRRALARAYTTGDFRLSCRSILELRERHGDRYPARDVGQWMEEGIVQSLTCRGMLDYVRRQSEARLPGPPPR